MAVKLRLMRTGKKKQPTYRIVAADARSPRDGRFIEILGTYNPRTEPSSLTVNNERAAHWLSHGAQPSERVAKLLKIAGVTNGGTTLSANPLEAPADALASTGAASADEDAT